MGPGRIFRENGPGGFFEEWVRAGFFGWSRLPENRDFSGERARRVFREANSSRGGYRPDFSWEDGILRKTGSGPDLRVPLEPVSNCQSQLKRAAGIGVREGQRISPAS